ncbi:MAG: YlzJ-like family protein [Firmicutes bacterium]|uniref:YlzJ-like protein n=1 Tax=Melghirimyces thermohalophilus TaxID=1236220 RepID=A0A1G6J2U2_9BACL|nr:YlzJ-like family protein [Melghirimyces thermohalophilus]MDA8352355.1 YlzJ-like family protein [Bacillota bacterium]SDC12969.1 YlzJ-like protein [Melghirimyces thermohalophilus]
MIYYSVIPMEAALTDPSEQGPEIREVDVGGVSMVVEMEGGGQGRILRLLSTDPGHYLDPRYQPGSRVRL